MLKHVALRLTPGCRTPWSDAFGFVPEGSTSVNHVHCKCHQTWGQSFLSAASLETLLCNLTYLWCVAQSCHLLYTAGDATPSNLEEVTITVGALTANNHIQPTFYANVSPALKEKAFYLPFLQHWFFTMCLYWQEYPIRFLWQLRLEFLDLSIHQRAKQREPNSRPQDLMWHMGQHANSTRNGASLWALLGSKTLHEKNESSSVEVLPEAAKIIFWASGEFFRLWLRRNWPHVWLP